MNPGKYITTQFFCCLVLLLALGACGARAAEGHAIGGFYKVVEKT